MSTVAKFWVLCQKDLCFVGPLEIITVLSNVNIKLTPPQQMNDTFSCALLM